MTHRQLVGIDVIRFLAAVFVTVFHLGAAAWLAPMSTRFEAVRFPELVPVARNGWIGVEIFFVISGFVIAYSANGAAASDFARSRFLRLAPAAWICASLTLAASLAAGLQAPGDLAVPYLKALLFWPGGPWIDGVYWTLGIELAFYAVIFALLVLRAWHRMPLVVGAIGLVSAGFHVAALFVPSLAALGDKRAAQLVLLHDGCLFALGAFLWLALTQAATRGRFAMIALLLVGGGVEVIGHNAYFMRLLGLDGSALAPLALFLGAVGLLVLSVLWNDRLVAALGRRGASLARNVGLMTYPLYLLHNVCGALLARLCEKAGCPRGLALALAIAAMVALAFAVTRLAEPSLRGLVARIVAGRPRMRPAALGPV